MGNNLLFSLNSKPTKFREKNPIPHFISFDLLFNILYFELIIIDIINI